MCFARSNGSAITCSNPTNNLLKRTIEKYPYPAPTSNQRSDGLQNTESGNKENIDCSQLDILEQAWIEVVLEKQHDSLIFPYGTNWFENTNQINEFIETYPSYLKHMNPRLPWYNGIKNPYYLKDKID